MIQFEKSLYPICKLVNESYEEFFPNLSNIPKFSIARIMITFWKSKVYSKIETNLMDAYAQILGEERADEEKIGVEKLQCKSLNSAEKKPRSNTEAQFKKYPSNYKLITKFGRCMADLSINEFTVHNLGSTKFTPETPYEKINAIFLKNTKYIAKY